ncbi:hypothetical protein JR316_0006970 [Psilocybe cubensis]|uniref:Uncharacterized protein n=2 Tax=Psilocybe cubensis TaxID=181762 RepID=A0ACB8GYB5_PSICU|nr:hypothetical protein JR316_0006970 [Psilocybe cubensis]KAH9480372.1 hypothetical protein JR316_0006970 [Psilocybe cubensis]
MAPKLRVLAHNARLEERMQSQISTSLASVLKTNPKLTPKEAMWTVTNEMLTNNPFQPPKDGKCPINDLPNEILGYIFSVGVEEEEMEEEWEDDEDAWVDEDSDEEGDDDESDDSDSNEDEDEDEDSENGSAMDFAAERLELSDSDSEDEHEPRVPFQVLVSHVCRRWREVALDSHVLWTFLDFSKRPNLEKAQVYISRAQGLPLNIFIDCTFPEDVDEEDHPDHPLYHDNVARKKSLAEGCDDEECEGHDEHDHDFDVQFLSQKQLTQIMDLIEPEVSHWRQLDFRASTYGYVHLFLSRLHALPSAPLLESFQVCHFEDCEDYEFFSGDDKTAFLPFHGDAPLLKDIVLWGVHIDWDAPFLKGLRELELSYHAKDVRPSYQSFANMINNSPELNSLTISLSGPVLPEGVRFDADPEEEEGAWGPTPLTIPSLKDFAIQFLDPRTASALVQHLDMPGLTDLLLNFDEEDYSSFVRTIVKPVKGRTESVLSHVENLKISGLPCDVASVEVFLSQLTKLKALNLKVVGVEEEVFFNKLLVPNARGPSSSSQASAAGSSTAPALPSVFLPQLKSITTNGVSGARLKNLVIARRDRGVPLTSVIISEQDSVSKKQEKWLRANVKEVEFFVPSDSEEEIDDDELDIIGIEERSEDDVDDDDNDEDGDDQPDDVVDEDGQPLFSPLARHLRRGRGGRAGGGGLD